MAHLHLHQQGTCTCINQGRNEGHIAIIIACYKRQYLTVSDRSRYPRSAASRIIVPLSPLVESRSLVLSVACKHSMTPPVHWPFSRPPTSRELPRTYLMTAPTHAACVKACIIQKHEINNPHACISSRIDDV